MREGRGADPNAALARTLAPRPMPDALGERVGSALEEALETAEREGREDAGGRESSARWAQLGIAAAVLALVCLALWPALRPPVELFDSTAELTDFERAALREHLDLAAGGRLDLISGSPQEIAQWLMERGLDARLATLDSHVDIGGHVGAGAAKLAPAGVRAAAALSFPAGAVHYRVDGAPVTLLAARAADVPDNPRWRFLGKEIRHTVDPLTRAHLLSWTNSGKAYTLVSELPGPGVRACLLCHVDDPRRELIARLEEQTPGS